MRDASSISEQKLFKLPVIHLRPGGPSIFSILGEFALEDWQLSDISGDSVEMP